MHVWPLNRTVADVAGTATMATVHVHSTCTCYVHCTLVMSCTCITTEQYHSRCGSHSHHGHCTLWLWTFLMSFPSLMDVFFLFYVHCTHWYAWGQCSYVIHQILKECYGTTCLSQPYKFVSNAIASQWPHHFQIYRLGKRLSRITSMQDTTQSFTPLSGRSIHGCGHVLL